MYGISGRFIRSGAAALAWVVLLVAAGCGDDPNPALGGSESYDGIIDPAIRKAREERIAKLPQLAIKGPTMPTADARLTAADVAKMDAATFWGWTRRTDTPEKLEQLVRWGAKRKLHEPVWDAMWGRIETPGAPGNEKADALFAEADRLATAVVAVTGDRSYRTRVREWENAHNREGRKREWVEARIAAARRALEEENNPGLAKGRLDACRNAAKKLGDTELLQQIASLEARLPTRKKQ